MSHSLRSRCTELGANTVADLRGMARDLEVPRYSTLTKRGLCVALSRAMENEDEIDVEVVAEDDIPDDMLDPVSSLPLSDAMWVSSGNSYNTETLQNFFQTQLDNGLPVLDPLNRRSIDITGARPNDTLRRVVRSYLHAHGLEDPFPENNSFVRFSPPRQTYSWGDHGPSAPQRAPSNQQAVQGGTGARRLLFDDDDDDDS